MINDDTTARIVSLEKRVAILEHEREILNTLYRYAHAIDYGDEVAWVDCFVESGIFDVRLTPVTDPAAERMIYVVGHSALAEFIRQHPRAPNVLHKHLLLNPRIDLNGSTAGVQSYFELLLERNRERQIFCFGRYLDELSLCDDGRWRFTLRRAEVQSTSLAGLPSH